MIFDQSPPTTYCTPEEVADTLDLPDLNDHYGNSQFSDMSHPSYDQVCRMIRANEDIIDRRVRRSWKENFVRNQQLSINEYWADINGWRSDYYQRGGHYIQLRKDVRLWDPEPRYSPEVQTAVVQKTAGEAMEVGKDAVVTRSGKVGNVISKTQKADGTYEVEYHPQTWCGDRLEIRNRGNTWTPITETVGTDAGKSQDNTNCFIDYPYGKLYLRTRLYQQKANAVRICYRYGQEEEPPEAIRRLCCLLTAIQVLNMQAFYIKIGSSGDIGNVRNAMTDAWREEVNSIYSSFQRTGSVHAMWS